MITDNLINAIVYIT